MLTTETALMFAKYSDWADQVLFKAMQKLPGDAVYRTRQTLFGSMVGTLNHNYQVDLIWRAHLIGEKHGLFKPPRPPASRLWRSDTRAVENQSMVH